MAKNTWFDTNGAPISGATMPMYGDRYKTSIAPDSYIKSSATFQPKANASLAEIAKPPAVVPTPTQTATSGTSSYVPTPVSSGGGAYASAVDAQLAANLAPIRAQMQINRREYDLAKQRLDANRDEALRQAYVESRMQQRNLPQQLARTGYNGGLAESTMAGLANTYMNNRNALELQHADDLADLEFEKYKADMELNAMIAQAQAEAEASRLASRSSGGGSSSATKKQQGYVYNYSNNPTYNAVQTISNIVNGSSSAAEANAAIAALGLTEADVRNYEKAQNGQLRYWQGR